MISMISDSTADSSIRVDRSAIFVSLELGKATWLVTALSPGSEKLSRFTVSGGNIQEVFAIFANLRAKADAREGVLFPIVVIYEAGLDGFWIARVLRNESWIECHVVDAASIAVSRRHRRVKTDRVDGEALVRTLMAHKRGEARVCSMVIVPTHDEEDRRRLSRERKILTSERIQHVNRIKGLLFSQGIRGYEPLRVRRRERLTELTTGDGRSLPKYLLEQVCREIDRLELIIEQIKNVEAARDELLEKVRSPHGPETMVQRLRGIGPEFATILCYEGMFRDFSNRRQLAAYAGLAPSPWKSGTIDREQGVSKAGNPRLRTAMVQLAWLWLRYQPDSALSLWFKQRVLHMGGRAKKSTIVALARKLLVAIWKYAKNGVIIDGATLVEA